MKRKNILYLCLSFAFIVLLILSIIMELPAKIIIGYSIASFIYSIMDLLSTIYEGKQKLNDLRDSEFYSFTDELKQTLAEETSITLSSLNQSINNIDNTKQELMAKILDNNFSFKKEKNKALNKPTKLVEEIHKKQSNLGLSIFDNITDSFQNFKPYSENSLIDIINQVLLALSIVIIIVSPTIPDVLFNKIPSIVTLKLGTALTLFSLSIIFLTNFLRNGYYEKAEELQYKRYYELINEINNFKHIADKRNSLVQQNLEQFSKSLDDVGQLISMGINKELQNDKTKTVGS